MALTQAQRKALRLGVSYATQGMFLVSGVVKGVGMDYDGEPAPYIPERTAEALVRAGMIEPTRIPSRFKLTPAALDVVEAEHARDLKVHGISRLGDDARSRFEADGYKAEVTVWWRPDAADVTGLSGQYLASHTVTRNACVRCEGPQRKVPTASVSPDDFDAVIAASKSLYEGLGYDTAVVKVRSWRDDVVGERREAASRRVGVERLVGLAQGCLDTVSTREDAGVCGVALAEATSNLVVASTIQAAMEAELKRIPVGEPRDSVVRADSDAAQKAVRFERDRLNRIKAQTSTDAWQLLRRVESRVGQNLDARIRTGTQSLRLTDRDEGETVTLSVDALRVLTEALEASNE